MTEPTNSQVDRLTRPREGRIFAGVSLAFAERLRIDVSLVRIGFVVSTFFGGLGVWVYLAAWFLIPNEGETKSPAEDMFSKD